MLNTDPCFISFKNNIDQHTLPKHFTFPFSYKPHPLCALAAKELQHYLETQHKWQHNFGLDNDKETATGKMFGVLLVKNEQQEIGYLTAFSGKFCGEYNLGRFVPAIPQIAPFEKDFGIEQANINTINHQITALENAPQISELKNEMIKLTDNFQTELTHQQTLMAQNRKNRKEQRINAENISKNKLTTKDSTNLLTKLAKESVYDKNQLKTLKLNWQQQLDNVDKKLHIFINKITTLKNERQSRSSKLQNKLFQQYQLLNALGETQSLQDVFKPTPQKTPPSGAGDCAAPKLIQYAFKKKLKILAMAEFWWGKSPKSEIRKHQNYYPACSGKCEPILNWMLKGVEIDKNPLLINTAESKPLEILYQDEVMAIVNKPNELLSVPGKHIQDSVFNRIKQLIPTASGPIIVHRLDMSTSGLMVVALTKRAHKQLQKQFIQRKVEKRYVALLNGAIKASNGEITLPLKEDFYNRPQQLVCEKNGKHAHTKWQVIGHTSKNQTKLYLFPTTGRTHQLRVHCAHSLGLNVAILGDDLYGTPANRLHLHAEKITLLHPITKAEISFQAPEPF